MQCADWRAPRGCSDAYLVPSHSAPKTNLLLCRFSHLMALYCSSQIISSGRLIDGWISPKPTCFMSPNWLSGLLLKLSVCNLQKEIYHHLPFNYGKKILWRRRSTPANASPPVPLLRRHITYTIIILYRDWHFHAQTNLRRPRRCSPCRAFLLPLIRIRRPLEHWKRAIKMGVEMQLGPITVWQNWPQKAFEQVTVHYFLPSLEHVNWHAQGKTNVQK